MTKRRRGGSQDANYGYDDNPIGLTEAFAPVKGTQSVDYDADDSQIGLTQAFGAVVPEEEPTYGWNDEDKWSNFDWNANVEPVEGQTATGEQPPVQAEAAQPAAAAATATATATPAGVASDTKAASGRGRHAAPDPSATPKMRKSRRTRRILIALIVLLLAGLAALGYFAYRSFTESQLQAAQHTQEQTAAPKDEYDSGAAADVAHQQATVKADVPDLSQILGMTQDDAVAALKRGAQVSSTNEASEDEAPIKTHVNVTLTEEPSDSRGVTTPTVYLGLDADGKVVQAGYSASAAVLGYGSVSFDDAVSNEHIIEKTLKMIGVDVPEGTATLPDSKDAYSTYASDGTTVMKENYSFSGTAEVNSLPCSWSAVLSYDYTKQVLSGNLSDTVRIVYVYVTLDS